MIKMKSALALLLLVTAMPARTDLTGMAENLIDDWSRSAEADRLARSAQKARTPSEPFIVSQFVQPVWQTPESRAAAALHLEKKCSDAGGGFHVIGERLEISDSWRMQVLWLVQMCAPGGKIILDGRTRALLFEKRAYFVRKGPAEKTAGDALVRQCASKSPGASLLRDEHTILHTALADGAAYAVGICRS